MPFRFYRRKSRRQRLLGPALEVRPELRPARQALLRVDELARSLRLRAPGQGTQLHLPPL